MTAYAAIFSARFRTLLQYRAAAAAGFATQVCWGFIRVMIFEAFFASSVHKQPMRLDETITYIWLGQCLLGLLPFQPDGDVRQMIRTGAVAYEMVRPVDLYGFWYARAIADRLGPTLLRAVPMMIVAALFLGLKPPPNWQCAAAWCAATAGAVLISAAITTLMTISLLWTTAGDGIARLTPPIVFFLSGMILPLVFLPAAVQPIVNALPFRDIVDVPFRLYMGHIPISQWSAIFAQELAWIVVLIGLGRLMFAQGLSKLVVQGG